MRPSPRHPLLGRYLAALLLFAFAVAVFFHEPRAPSRFAYRLLHRRRNLDPA